MQLQDPELQLAPKRMPAFTEPNLNTQRLAANSAPQGFLQIRAFREGGKREKCTIPGESQEVEDFCVTDQLSRNSKKGPSSCPELGHPMVVDPPWHLGH